jgi:hypothetical protein
VTAHDRQVLDVVREHIEGAREELGLLRTATPRAVRDLADAVNALADIVERMLERQQAAREDPLTSEQIRRMMGGT